jgi:hypothetical protein
MTVWVTNWQYQYTTRRYPVLWNSPADMFQRTNLEFEGASLLEQTSGHNHLGVTHCGLERLPGPARSPSRSGVNTSTYQRRILRDYAEQDARNRKLGLVGERAVVESERILLICGGRADLAERILHVAIFHCVPARCRLNSTNYCALCGGVLTNG